MNDDLNTFRNLLDNVTEIPKSISQVQSPNVKEEILPDSKPIILIVDDDSNVRQALSITLQKKYNPVLCSTGKEGIENTDILVHAVLLDIKMEGKDGFETLLEIKKKNPYLPIIFHSAYQDLKDPMEIMNEFRPFGYIVKGENSRQLLITLDSAVEYYSQVIKNIILNKELESSEIKYRNLVENSLDIIFSLDSKRQILSVSRTVNFILRRSPKTLLNKNFSELIYKANISNLNIVEEKLQELITNKDSVEFNCEFSSALDEPKEVKIKMKYVPMENDYEIFATASNEENDMLVNLCKAETQIYILENYIANAELLSQRISAAASKYCDLEFTYKLKMCVRELLVNAIEHGNLGISYDEKTDFMNKGEYLSIVMQRQKDPLNRNKEVKVEYSLSPEQIEIRITDEGKGFDHKKIMASPIEDSLINDISHGRGIALAKDFLDTMEYNQTGNSVFILKKFPTGVLVNPS